MNEEYIRYMTPQDLLTHIRTHRAAIESLWANLDAEQMTRRPAVQETWSVKDLIAHLTFWEGWAIDKITALQRGETVDSLATDAAVDAINADVYAHHQDDALDDVLTAWRDSQGRVEALVTSLSEHDLNHTDAYPQSKYPFLQYLIENTFEHYQDHIDDLRAYVYDDEDQRWYVEG